VPPKPLVQVACVCENVLTETDNVQSVIRIVDTYTLHVPEGKTVEDSVVLLTALVALKSGEVTGEHTIGLRLVPPDGRKTQDREWPVVFNGGAHGANVKIQFAIPGPSEGLYWFDVLWGSEILTRIPFRLKTVSVPATTDLESMETTRRSS
jgi:hypothetical protein